MVVQVQAILFTSIAISLLALVLVILAVIWGFSEYPPIDTQRPTIERNQNRERNLGRIDHVMESLPSMLQVTLFLRGCALSRYFLDTHPTMASVVLNITSFCVIPYLYIVIIWVVFPIWPYQTPGKITFPRVVHIPGLLHSTFSAFIERSICRHLLPMVRDEFKGERRWGRYTEHQVIEAIGTFLLLPTYLFMDAYRLLLAIIWPFIAPYGGGTSGYGRDRMDERLR